MKTANLLSILLIAQVHTAWARTTITGRFEVVWGDPPPVAGQRLEPRIVYSLNQDGVSRRLDIPSDVLQAAGGGTFLNRRMVIVETERAKQSIGRELPVTSLRLRDDEKQIAAREHMQVSGSQPFIWILLRFKDDPSTPRQPAWFTPQTTGPWPSLDNYWREVSLNNIDIVGSHVVGWYDLPRNRTNYVHDIDPDDPGDEVDLSLALDDAIALADADVFFPDYIGINLIFNGDLDGPAWGGSRECTVDGQTKTYGVTWMPPWGWQRQSVLAHEMGHAFGLPHSSGLYDQTYDSQWDVMSKTGGTKLISDPTYGDVGPGTIAYHKDMLGWIPPERCYVTPMPDESPPFYTRLILWDLNTIAPAGTYQIVKLSEYSPFPDPVSKHFYSIERRKFTGYDRNIPDETVVMHSVWTLTERPARVVDADKDGDCNDDGARWKPGEGYSCWLTGYNVWVIVESNGVDSSTIVVSNISGDPVYVDASATGYEVGSSEYPWNTILEGAVSVRRRGDVFIRPGHYSEPLTLFQSMTLNTWGPGSVVIGQ